MKNKALSTARKLMVILITAFFVLISMHVLAAVSFIYTENLCNRFPDYKDTIETLNYVCLVFLSIFIYKFSEKKLKKGLSK